MFKRTFWNGIKAFVPLALTIGIVLWLLNILENFFGHMIQYVIPHQYYFKGLGILLGIIFIFLMGILVNAWFVKWFYQATEKLMQKIPGIKTIYNAIQDLVNFFDKSKHADDQQAVLIDLPMGKIIGFVTRSNLKELPFSQQVENRVLVYIPLSYQIGGLAVAIEREKLVPLDWPADQVMSFILTAGMTTQRQ